MSSARTARRLNRILAMVPWVLANPGATVTEVCERFGYQNRRQLVDDLNLVFVCGLPGYGPGDLMVAYVDEDEVVVEMAEYFARPLRLSAPEALGLLAAGRALLSSGLGSPELEAAVAKVEAVVLPDSDDRVVVDLAEPPYVSLLRRAAAEGMVVRIEYRAVSTGEGTTRDVEPWMVFSTLGNWYVRGHCRRADAERVFRVDRIRFAEETGDHFEPPAELPPPEVRYTPEEGDVRATIRLGPAARWVADYYPVEIEADDGVEMVIRFSASDPAVPARLLVRLGAAAELVEGAEVARSAADLRARILARYTR
jgi:proteasome accessory factor C